MKRELRRSVRPGALILAGMFLLGLVCGGCGGSREGQSDAERGPLDHPRVLELAGDLPGALREYTLLAGNMAGTETGQTAIRRAAYLNAYLRNDSAALYWYRALDGLPLSIRERELVRLQISSLERITALTARLEENEGNADSLRNATKHLSAANSAQGRQIRDLEAQLKKVSEELRQLKEIDARLSGRNPAK
jgi:hypothetical protein